MHFHVRYLPPAALRAIAGHAGRCIKSNAGSLHIALYVIIAAAVAAILLGDGSPCHSVWRAIAPTGWYMLVAVEVTVVGPALGCQDEELHEGAVPLTLACGYGVKVRGDSFREGLHAVSANMSSGVISSCMVAIAALDVSSPFSCNRRAARRSLNCNHASDFGCA